MEATPGQSNTLDVNWIPVTITDKGASNGARVTGYKVYINGFPCTEVTSPTADCVTAVSWMVERASKKSHSDVLRVIVRTQSCEGESADSNEVVMPLGMFNFKANQVIKPKETEEVSQNNDMLLERSFGNHGGHEGSDNLVNGELVSEPPRERADSVRRFSMGENGQPQVVLVEDIAKHTMDDSGPLAQPRTKGEPVVWKYEAGDESETAESITKSDGRSGSEDEDDEEVEICIPDDSEDKEQAAKTETVVNVEDQGYQRLEEVPLCFFNVFVGDGKLGLYFTSFFFFFFLCTWFIQLLTLENGVLFPQTNWWLKGKSLGEFKSSFFIFSPVHFSFHLLKFTHT